MGKWKKGAEHWLEVGVDNVSFTKRQNIWRLLQYWMENSIEFCYKCNI